MNTAVVSLNAAVRQMTEMFRWPKCRSKKKQVASTFVYWECPLQNLLYIVYVFLAYAINNVSLLLS